MLAKSDIQLKEDIEEELRWDPKVNAAQVGVTVNNGAVSLLGTVDTYPQKCAAEDVAKRVAGVRALARDLTVKIAAGHRRTDADIAAAVLSTLKWNVFVPKTVTATVQNGTVTLEGHATWHYQREAAARAVCHLTGVVAVVNSISLKPDVSAAKVRELVQAALERQASVDTDSIKIDIAGGKVTLTGYASSWQSIEDAANAAWAAPGVTEVLDQVKMSMTL